MVARGEVWWYAHPDAGRRPYLVLSRNEAIPVLNQLIAIPATRTIRGIPTEVRLSTDDGMPTECVLAVDNVSLIRPEFCTERITSLGPDKLRAVCDAFAFAIAC